MKRISAQPLAHALQNQLRYLVAIKPRSKACKEAMQELGFKIGDLCADHDNVQLLLQVDQALTDVSKLFVPSDTLAHLVLTRVRSDLFPESQPRHEKPQTFEDVSPPRPKILQVMPDRRPIN